MPRLIPELNERDLERLQRWPESLWPRARMELAITRMLIETLVAAGFSITVDYDEQTSVVKSTDVEEIIDEATAADEAQLVVYTEALARLGWVQLVFGNDGWDLIADHTQNLTEALHDVNTFADVLGEWGV